VLLVGYILVLAGIAAATVPTLVGTVHTLDEQRNHFDPTAQAADALLTNALNQETGERGYVLSGDAQFLVPFDAGAAGYRSALADLRTRPLSSEIRQRVETVDLAFEAWRQIAVQAVADVRAGNGNAARAAALNDTAKSRFDTFRADQHALSVAVSEKLDANRASLRREVERSLAGLLVALGAGLLLAGALWSWWRVFGRPNALGEQRLADTAVLLQSAIDAMNEPIFAKDREGRHILANRARAASLAAGDPDVPMIGRSVDEFVDADLAARIRRDETEIMTSGIEVRLEEPLRQPDGVHVFMTTKSPLYDAAGSVIGIVGVARDVTEERALIADRERLYQIEHRFATTLQQAMLGSSRVDDPRVAVCARYQPASEDLTVGGDWYDVVELPDGTIGLIVGDAVGRGIDAATVMGQLRSALSSLAYTGADPARTLEYLDRFARTIRGARSTTCLYVILDPAREQLSYSCAGHIPPMVVGPDGTCALLDQMQDPPLAITRGQVHRRCATHAFPVGSTIVLCTDGLVERRGESIDRGFERLSAAVGGAGGSEIDNLCDDVIKTLLVDSGQRDDVAVVLARLVGAPAGGFSLTVPAEPEQARRVRHEFEHWLGEIGVTEDERNDIVLALGEAVANSIEHGYDDGTGGAISVEAERRSDGMRIVVQDRGRWRVPRADANRGRGVPIMRQCVDNVEISTTPTGTTVVLETHVGASL
jgi:PAS domain S-box-containing protein